MEFAQNALQDGFLMPIKFVQESMMIVELMILMAYVQDAIWAMI
jgi:hypothetical protein